MSSSLATAGASAASGGAVWVAPARSGSGAYGRLLSLLSGVGSVHGSDWVGSVACAEYHAPSRSLSASSRCVSSCGSTWGRLRVTVRLRLRVGVGPTWVGVDTAKASSFSVCADGGTAAPPCDLSVSGSPHEVQRAAQPHRIRPKRPDCQAGLPRGVINSHQEPRCRGVALPKRRLPTRSVTTAGAQAEHHRPSHWRASAASAKATATRVPSSSSSSSTPGGIPSPRSCGVERRRGQAAWRGGVERACTASGFGPAWQPRRGLSFGV